MVIPRMMMTIMFPKFSILIAYYNDDDDNDNDCVSASSCNDTF